MNKQEEKENKEIANKIIDAATTIHKVMGPGLQINAYQKCLQHALQEAGLEVVCEQKLPVVYDGVKIDTGYKLDMLVEDAVVVENKAVDKVSTEDEEELFTYLKFSGCNLGLLINWKTTTLKQGIKIIET